VKPLLSKGLESADPAMAFFRELVPMTDAEWLKLERWAQKKAFHIAGVAQLRAVTDVWDSLNRAIDNGTTFETFKADIASTLYHAWQSPRPWRLQNIFRTNVQRAYMAGRVHEMDEPAVKALRPFRRYDTAEDEDVCPICGGDMDGTILPADDPWWDSHTPPLHFQCRCGITSLMAEDVDEEDVGPPENTKPPLDGFGEYPEMNEPERPLVDYPAELVEVMDQREAPEELDITRLQATTPED
jgi:SPP1 gp7 family putative phage head morphogenesis protein